ncbi:MAG: hypothetical protein K2P81_13895 [Bacteriovoracaceae bacterium]|nr:hypothetical protein [Bacteriovoracaceae bacterium]
MNLFTKPLTWSLPFLLGSAYHVLALLIPNFGEPSPTWRHLLFLLIGLVMTALAYKNKKAFKWALSLLSIQQIYSHGSYLIEVWKIENRIDYWSVITLVAFPLMMVMSSRFKENSIS